jgi:monoamine oxidase
VPGPSIAIVGAGIAGLTCALELADAGLASTVYDASDRIGGRMHSNTGYFDDGQSSEWCGELIDTNHETILELAERFELAVHDLWAAHPDGSEDTYSFFGDYYPRAEAERDFAPVYRELQRCFRAAGFPTTYRQSTRAGRALDSISVHDWIERHIAGGHRSPMGMLFEVAYAEELAVSTREQSALTLVYMLGNQPDPEHFEMFGISDERWHIAGGNQRLPEAIAAELGVGSTVLTGWRLDGLSRTPAGRYSLDFTVGPDARRVVCDYAVLCMPFPVLRTLDYARADFDARKVHAIRELGGGRSGKLQLQFRDRIWNERGPWPGIGNGNSYVDTGYQNAWDVTRGQDGPNGILVDYTGGPATEEMTADEAYSYADSPRVLADARRFLERIEPVYPGLTERWKGKAASSLPHLDPNLLCSYSHWKVGQYQTIAGYEGVRQGNCLFAGEHTSVVFQGFMEGGASSGRRAAQEILGDLGQPAMTVSRRARLSGGQSS